MDVDISELLLTYSESISKSIYKFQTPPMEKYYKKLVEPYTDTISTNFHSIKNRTLQHSKYAFVATYEIQQSTVAGACSALLPADQALMYNDGSMAFAKDSPYTELFSYL